MNQAPHEMSGQAATALTREAHSQAQEDRLENRPVPEPAERRVDLHMTPNVTPSEAVYAFAAWLTTREETITIGSMYDCSGVALLVADFCKVQGFAPPRHVYPGNLKTMNVGAPVLASQALEEGRKAMMQDRTKPRKR